MRLASYCAVASFAFACAPSTDTTSLGVTLTASTANPLEGETVTLKATVKNATGDVSYKWEQVSPTEAALKGSFGSATAQTTFKVPGLCKDESFELRLSIKDDANGQAAATVKFDATNQDRMLELSSVNASKSTAVTGDLVTLNAEAYGPGCGPKYAWSQPTTPATGGFEGAVNAGLVTWRAPETPGTYRISLVVSDESGTALPQKDTDLTVEAPKYTRDIQPILNDQCGGCHGGVNPEHGLTLTYTTAAAMQTELAKMPTDTDGTTCGAPAGSALLTPGSLDDSVLWQRVRLDRANIPAGCAQMPRNNSQFFVANKDLYTRLKVWIASGASFAE